MRHHAVLWAALMQPGGRRNMSTRSGCTAREEPRHIPPCVGACVCVCVCVCVRVAVLLSVCLSVCCCVFGFDATSASNRQGGGIEPLHVSMPHELKSCPSTSPTHPGTRENLAGQLAHLSNSINMPSACIARSKIRIFSRGGGGASRLRRRWVGGWPCRCIIMCACAPRACHACECMCVCVCARVRARVCVCVCVRMCVCVCNCCFFEKHVEQIK